MLIKNDYNEKVFWRAFKSSDTSYVFGLKQGSIDPGGTDSWIDDSFPKIKVEVKTGDIVFSKAVLAFAGPIFNMRDELNVDQAGKLVLATVNLTLDQGQKSEKRSHLQFVDLRNFNADVERTMTSRVSQAFSNKESFEHSSGHEQTWTVGGKVGGTIGKKDEASVSSELSMGFSDKVTDALKASSETVVNSVWEQSWSDKLKFSPGKLYAIEVVWTITLDCGTATYLGQKTSYSVVRSAVPNLLKPSGYDSPEKLPAAYQESWKQVGAAAAANA